jgi:hypothetical protein
MELPWAEADAIATAVRNSDPKLLEMEDRVRQRVDQLDSRCVALLCICVIVRSHPSLLLEHMVFRLVRVVSTAAILFVHV